MTSLTLMCKTNPPFLSVALYLSHTSFLTSITLSYNYIFSCTLPTLIFKFLESRGSAVSTTVCNLGAEQDSREMAVLKNSLLIEKSPLKIMQTLRFIWRLLGIFNTYRVSLDEVTAFPNLTRAGNSWHLINSSALSWHKTNYSVLMSVRK